MTAPPRTSAMVDSSPKGKARLAGILYLLTMILGIIAQMVIGGRLIVPGDAAATAANITAHESMYRLALAIYLIEMTCQIILTVLFYELLKPVSKSASLVAAVLGLVGCTVKLIGRLFFAAPLLVLGGAPYLAAITPTDLHTAGLFFLRINYLAETFAMVFFGLHGIVSGYLEYRSTFLPRAIGLLSMIGGLGWLTYLYEPAADKILVVILATAFLGSLVTIAWFLIYGVNEDAWRESARRAETSIWR